MLVCRGARVNDLVQNKHLFLQNTSGGCFRKLNIEKSTILNSEGLKRGTKRLNTKNK